MFEIFVLAMLLLLIAISGFAPLTNAKRFFSAKGSVQAKSSLQPETRSESYSFLNHLQSEIEADLFPRPTDSVLRRHYDTLVAVELRNRLALMAE
jgi:hypothetical protein